MDEDITDVTGKSGYEFEEKVSVDNWLDCQEDIKELDGCKGILVILFKGVIYSDLILLMLIGSIWLFSDVMKGWG